RADAERRGPPGGPAVRFGEGASGHDLLGSVAVSRPGTQAERDKKQVDGKVGPAHHRRQGTQASPRALSTRRSSGTNSSWLTATPTARISPIAANAPAMSLASCAFFSRNPSEWPKPADWT